MFLDLIISMLAIIEVLMIATTVMITMNDSIPDIIKLYRRQTYLLLVVILVTAMHQISLRKGISNLDTAWFLVGISVIPILLVIYIDALLKMATSGRLRIGLRPDKLLTPAEQEEIQRIWSNSTSRDREIQTLEHSTRNDGHSVERANSARNFGNWNSLLAMSGLVLFSFLVANELFPTSESPASAYNESLGLAVSLSLHLIGLYNTIVKRDFISQVIGLLIMDQGLYLAVVKVVAIPVPALFFVLALFFYTFITIIVLVVMTPQVIRFNRADEGDVSETPPLSSIDLDIFASTSPLSEKEGTE